MISQHSLLLLLRKRHNLPRYDFEQLLIIHSIERGIFHVGQDKPDGSFFILSSNLREAYFLVILTNLVNETVVSAYDDQTLVGLFASYPDDVVVDSVREMIDGSIVTELKKGMSEGGNKIRAWNPRTRSFEKLEEEE
jgi:hypothetical protein